MMKLKTYFVVVTAGIVGTAGMSNILNAGVFAQPQVTSTTQIAQAPQQDVKFICSEGYDRESGKRFPTTYAWTPRGKLAVIRWKDDYFKGSGYGPQKRCDQVSPKFDQAYQSGMLKFIASGKENGQPVICSVRELGEDCAVMLMTLRPADDPEKFVINLVEVLKGRATGPVQHSGGEQMKYYRLNVESFLSTATPDGE
jgi:hypothetical protein